MSRAAEPVGRTSATRRVLLRIAAALALVLLATWAWRSHVSTRDVRDRRMSGSAAAFAVDSMLPEGRATLLFLDGRPTLPLPDGRRVATTEDGVLRIADRQLHLTVVSLPALQGTMVGAAPAGDGDWWISDRDGALRRVSASGRVQDSAAAPFPAAALWPLPTGGLITSRSPERFSFEPESADAPMLVALDARRRPTAIGTTVRPQHALLTTVANAGYVAARGDSAYFAPLGRNELLAVRFDGTVIWRRLGGPAIATPEPRFQVSAGSVRVEYQPYNLGLTLAPDGLLYRLRTLDTAMTAVALDVIEPATGRIRATHALGSPRVTLALDDNGQLHLLDIARLLDAAVPAEREPLPPFDLPTPRGGESVTLAGYRGKLLLLNFWASWCGPCRTEMPALDSLHRQLSVDGRFAVLAMNVDADRAQANAFLAQRNVQLPIAYGGPALQSRYRYPGLPYTILVDAQGRVIRRWIGQLEAADFITVRTLVRTELLRAGVSDSMPARLPPSHHVHVHAP